MAWQRFAFEAWPAPVTSRVVPDAILTQTNLAGALSTITDDPDSADASWMTGAGGTEVLRVSFASPPNTLALGAGRQEFRVRVRPGT